MRLLLHVGLNKCASSFIQNRLNANADALARVGVFYPREKIGNGQYGLSKHYGFGPESETVRAHSLAAVARLARRRGAHSVILSSEYLSLKRPKGIERLMADIETEGFERPSVLFFARPVEQWVRSLFNQYVRSVDGSGNWLPSIDAYVNQVMKNGAINIAGRFKAWEQAVGPDRIRLIDIDPELPTESVLRPFEHFAGIKLRAGQAGPINRSIPPGVLYILGLIRRAPPSAARSELLHTLFTLERAFGKTIPAPPGYEKIGPEQRARIAREIEGPFAALPRSALEPEFEEPASARVA